MTCVPARACVPPARRADEPQLDAGAGGRLDDPGEVLARLECPDCEHVLALGGVAVRMEDRLERVRDDVDPVRIDARELDHLPLRELRDRDDAIGRANRRAERRPPVEPRPERKDLGMPEHGEVVHGEDRRHARARRRAEDRAVQDVDVRVRGLTREQPGVPEHVAGDGRPPARPAPAERQ